MPTKTVVSPSDGHEFEIELKNTDAWHLTALGCGVIAYYPIPNERKFKVLLAQRAVKVGEGLGITGGGFAKIENILKSSIPLDTVVQGYAEAYVEACEENDGFENIISFKWFEQRAQEIASFLVRTSDENQSHACMQYGLRITDTALWEKLKSLPPGKDGERVGDLIEAVVSYGSDMSRSSPEMATEIRIPEGRVYPCAHTDLPRFWHPHEPHAIGGIAWRELNDRLWRD